MTLRQLQEKREKLVADARSALDEIRKNTDDARAAELEQRHDTIMADFDKVEGDIKREERMAAAEQRAEESRARRRPNPGDGEARGEDDPEKPVEYRQAFQKWVASAGDLSALSPEERSALRAGVAPREDRAQTTGVPAAGGYTVPTELSNQIIVSMKAWGPMYDEDICTVMTTTSGNPIDLPTVDDTSVPVAKHTEAGAVTDDGGSDATFGKKTLNAYAYDTEWVKFSWELAQDSIFNFETLLGDLLGQRLGRRANTELSVGTGTNDPNGIVTASSLGKTAAAQAAITYDEIIDLVHSVDPAYRQSPKTRFMFNDTTLGALRKLKDGEGRYVWSAGDVQKGVPGSILGYNYSINQAMASLAAGAKPMIFGDFGKYFVRKVGGIVMFVAKERFAPDIGLLGLVRLDGELGDTAAVKHLITAAA
ncbi:phage major capsid protein [Brucella pseudogrignonensis]|uniref:phage major capsid protein n=1 Tax=Brucella pseudogrignonensis TaxID=419475 RepID=UPI000CFBECAD|nr:phage major capsid protein [Brucella pseudogrignonensis]MQP38644.1 phage major capsid protein [Ochrobactrum sp. MYb237]PQZ43261.1 phage major capsid protein [Brucella pseudogrignonensis]PRA43008.1 phage major capsid protein [Brucella pseudogrignonensis]PRA72524.1 phage major capsid protein [Brucella pseudogrignonensis]